jgi:hypothetical protein
MSYQLINPKYNILDVDGGPVIKRTQEITAEFLDECAENRLASVGRPMGEFHQFASIPTAVVEKWLREGFDIYNEPAKAIVARLRKEDLGAFITTQRSL